MAAAFANRAVIEGLRERIACLDGQPVRKMKMLPFGVSQMDACLPGGGLAYGAIHEIAGGGVDAVEGAAAAIFAGGIAARTRGKIVWCLRQADLFAPALAQVGLHPDRVIYVEAGREEDVLASFEEALRFGNLGAVVAEIVRLPLNASRRLQLAAESSGTLGLLLRRWRRPAEAAAFGNPTASATRWRITVLPSEPLPVVGVGRPRWLVELVRVRAGEGAQFMVGACDGEGRIHLSSEAFDRANPAQRSFA